MQRNDTGPSYIVGIGGSAGGLEAFGEFFSKLPQDTGMAFIVVQHLDPDHKAMLAELLQQSTKMPVVEIEDGMEVRPNSVYVIPPNKDLTILHGVLQLLEPSVRRGMRLPIDFFFRQLAEYVKHTVTASAEISAATERTVNAMQKILVILRSKTGHDFSLYKKGTLNRRVKRRMDVHLIAGIDEYIRYLQESHQEVDLLFKELLLGVTSFFRVAEAFEVLKKEIRDSIVFAPHNIAMDPPFTNMDVVSCRNLLIYFSSELQKKIIPLFHYSLNKDGLLFLGPSETISGSGDLFSTLDNKAKVFRQRGASIHRHEGVEFPSRRQAPAYDTHTADQQPEFNISEAAQSALLESYTPPAVLINELGDILYVNGRTGKYLEPPSGRVNWNIYAMAREGLMYDLPTAVRKALSQNSDEVVKGLSVKTNSHEQPIILTVKPLAKQKGGKAENNAVIAQYEEDLKSTRQRLQECVEQTQSTREELQSANEELQSSNEELQSTNEELTTSKEELQSLNEELTTVNSELQAKVEQLSDANNDMRNLLNNAEVATIFLDNTLSIRRFTSQVSNIIKIIESDVGRPVTDLISSLKSTSLIDDAQEVLETLDRKERQVQNNDDGWYIMRTMPYRTADNVIDGVVMTFTEITQLKNTEQAIIAERNFAANIIDAVREPLIVLDNNLWVVSANKSFYDVFKVTTKETEGELLYNLGNRQWDIPELRKLLEKVLPENAEMNDFVVEHDFSSLGKKKMLLNAGCIERNDEGSPLILLAMEDITNKPVCNT